MDDPTRDAAEGPAAFAFRPESVDPERIGALVDGRLSGQELVEVIAEIAASDEATDVFTDTAAIIREHRGPGD